jgi:alanine dehydrogenase
MLVLGLDEINELLTMKDCIRVLEKAYENFGNGKAMNIPRADMITPSSDRVHGFKTMSGSLPNENVVALRINSDIIHWPEINGQLRRVKIPAAPGDNWVGLVLLFSTETGELLAMMPDGVIQAMRVAATGGLGIKYMAKENASTVALLGSGWQARSAAKAACAVRPIQQIRVYSPNPENRTEFAREMSAEIGVEVIAVNSGEEACKGADIVSCATNALGKVFDAKWLEPGMHFVCVRHHEIDKDVYNQADNIVIHTKKGTPDHFIIDDNGQFPELKEGYDTLDLSSYPELQELVAGKIQGRKSEQDITIFSNNLGLGIQFAAVGKYVVELAKKQGKGHELPAEWFVQNVHP